MWVALNARAKKFYVAIVPFLSKYITTEQQRVRAVLMHTIVMLREDPTAVLS